MKKRFIKNAHYLECMILFIIFNCSFIVLLAMCLIHDNLLIGSVVLAILFVVNFSAFFIIKKSKPLAMVIITDTQISVRSFSKELLSFDWEYFDDISFGMNSRIRYVEFYKSGEEVLMFHIPTKKKLEILKTLTNLNPVVKDKIQKATYSAFGPVRVK